MSTFNLKIENNQKNIFWFELYSNTNIDKKNILSNENKKVDEIIYGKKLILNEEKLESYLSGRSKTIKNFMKKRLKLLLDICSKDVRKCKVSIETINRLAAFCAGIIPLIENNTIVMPTPNEFVSLIKWYIDKVSSPENEPAKILTTVCPDYPYECFEGRAVYTEGILGEDIGLVGESISNTGAKMVKLLLGTLRIPFKWIVGYAGFEAKKENLENMKINIEIFNGKLKESASKLQKELGVSVGIIPDILGITNEDFWNMRDGFLKEQFNIERKGMNALAQAIDTRDWACIYSIANHLNAIILDGASVYVGRRAYKNAERILKSEKYTPSFYCITNYEGYAR